jgi:hypothetical protein
MLSYLAGGLQTGDWVPAVGENRGRETTKKQTGMMDGGF